MPVFCIRFNFLKESIILAVSVSPRSDTVLKTYCSKMLVFNYVLSHHILWTVSYLLGCSEVLLPFLALPASVCLKRPVYNALLQNMRRDSLQGSMADITDPTMSSPIADITNQSLHSVF